MLAKERRKKIVSLLQKDGKVRIGDLSLLFSVTTETLRRDLSILQEEALLEKVHGGAILSSRSMKESNFYVRKSQNIKRKYIISELAARFIQEHDTVMLDASTTVFHLAERIESKKNIMIITNSLQALNTLCNSSSKIIGLGGGLDCSAYAFVGTQTLALLDSLYATHSFISCHGIDMKLEIMDISPEEAAIKETFLSNSSKRYLLIDSSKFGKKGAVKIKGLEKIDYVITDTKPAQEWISFFDKLSVQLVYPQSHQEDTT